MPDINFWRGKKVFVTGHTGFKGSWICLWLKTMRAEVMGYSLPPPTKPSLYETCDIESMLTSQIADIRDGTNLIKTMQLFQPEIVFHLAAQPLVRDSYKYPVETYQTNVMGTVNLFEAVRNSPSVRSVIIVTTDKCYENKEWVWGYRENDSLGGYDPYSGSKACTELITASYRNSFFNPTKYAEHQVGIATARAGNVIGGGDWASDRLVPDIFRAIFNGQKVIIRNPHAIRPWQHVLEPLNGYLMLAEKLYRDGINYNGSWNFGPNDEGCCTVEFLVRTICDKWPEKAKFEVIADTDLHEANYLKLDCSKAKMQLGWYPQWNLQNAIDKVIEWMIEYQQKQSIKTICLKQIQEFQSKEMRANELH